MTTEEKKEENFQKELAEIEEEELLCATGNIDTPASGLLHLFQIDKKKAKLYARYGKTYFSPYNPVSEEDEV